MQKSINNPKTTFVNDVIETLNETKTLNATQYLLAIEKATKYFNNRLKANKPISILKCSDNIANLI